MERGGSALVQIFGGLPSLSYVASPLAEWLGSPFRDMPQGDRRQFLWEQGGIFAAPSHNRWSVKVWCSFRRAMVPLFAFPPGRHGWPLSGATQQSVLVAPCCDGLQPRQERVVYAAGGKVGGSGPPFCHSLFLYAYSAVSPLTKC